MEFGPLCLCTVSDQIRLYNQLLWAGELLFCFKSLHKFHVLLTDCCLCSLHTHTQVLLYKKHWSKAVSDEFVQWYANVCMDDIPKSRNERTVNNYQMHYGLMVSACTNVSECDMCCVPISFPSFLPLSYSPFWRVKRKTLTASVNSQDRFSTLVS